MKEALSLFLTEEWRMMFGHFKKIMGGNPPVFRVSCKKGQNWKKLQNLNSVLKYELKPVQFWGFAKS